MSVRDSPCTHICRARETFRAVSAAEREAFRAVSEQEKRHLERPQSRRTVSAAYLERRATFIVVCRENETEIKSGVQRK